ncbi:MAG: Gldg family protein [Armatimonadota bacterium]
MPKDEELKDEEEQEPDEPAEEDEELEEASEGDDEPEEAEEDEEEEEEERPKRAKPRAARRAEARAAKKERKRRRKKGARQPRRVMREQVVEGLPLHVTLAPPAALVGAGVVVAGLIAWFVTHTFKWPVITLLAVGGALLIGALAIRFEGVVTYVRPRPTGGTLNTGVAVLLIRGIIVLANYVAMRYTNVKWDATEEKLFSLSHQTRKIVQGLEQKVQIGGFYARGTPYSQAEFARDIYGQYDELSPKLTAAVYDWRVDKDKVQEWNITSTNITIVRCGDRRKEVYTLNEQSLTNAILEVTTAKKPKLYFLEGHGEKTVEYGGGEAESYSTIKTKLEDQQYEVDTLNLAATGEEEPSVPEDCDVLLIIGPQYPLDPREVDAINDYLETFSLERKQTGRALIALRPAPAPDLHEIIGGWGVTAGEGRIVDFARNFFGYVSMPLTTVSEPHDITRDFPGGGSSIATFLTLPRPLEVEEQPEQYPPDYPGAPPPPPKRAVAVMKSADTSWAETDAVLSTESTRDGSEAEGPLPVLVAVDAKMGEEPPPPMPGQPPPDTTENTRLAVIGSADIATNELVRLLPGNETMFLACIAWLAERANLISVPPKRPEQRNLNLTSGQKRFTQIVTMGVVPLAVAFMGVLVWWRRR